MDANRIVLLEARGVLRERPARLTLFARGADAATAMRDNAVVAHLRMGDTVVVGRMVGLQRSGATATMLVHAAGSAGAVLGILSLRVDAVAPGDTLRLTLHDITHARELGHIEQLIAAAGPDRPRARQALLARVEALGAGPASELRVGKAHPALSTPSGQISHAG